MSWLSAERKQEKIAKMVELAKKGYTTAAIADKLDMPLSTVRRYYKYRDR